MINPSESLSSPNMGATIMTREFPSRSLGSTSDLVVMAPWKPGIVHADDLISYESRLALTFRTLYEIRRTAREAGQIPLLSDPIERLEQIHSFRIRASREGMLLAVTYDHHWEPYMTALSTEAGEFLDLLLCNCEGYRLARDTRADVALWARWIRENECPSDYFYAATSLTVADLPVLSQVERIQREDSNPVASDREIAGRPSNTSVEVIAQARKNAPGATHAQALRILRVMFGLTRYYGADVSPGCPLQQDSITLLRATRKLLAEWDYRDVRDKLRVVHARQIDWFEQPLPDSKAPPENSKPADRAKVQRGLIKPFATSEKPGAITHGAILLLRITNPDVNRNDAISSLRQVPLADEASGATPADGIFRTLAFTRNGFKNIGVAEASIAALGDAFNEGAAARAGQLGDIRSFHPESWKMPAHNWPPGEKGAVPLETIDIVITLRTAAPGNSIRDPHLPAHPLHGEIQSIAARKGLDLMHVEGLGPAAPGTPGVDHLGFRDGLSQPVLDVQPHQVWTDKVEEASMLIVSTAPELAPFREGSYLAIRKIAIDADRFDTLTERAAAEAGLPKPLVRAKLMGRQDNGTPLVPHAGKNDFNYSIDPKGQLCPLQSHVRRVNPRAPGKDAPRIVRRGMSFGPPAGTEPGVVRGSLFMASCGNLAEQYEVLLRWLNGGNSSRLGSWAADPVIGPASAGDGRIFAFPHAGRVCRVPMDDAGMPVTQLVWSLYAIVTPVDFLDRLNVPVIMPATAQTPAEKGEAIVAYLDTLTGQARDDAWLAALRDPKAERLGKVDDLWAYVRTLPGSILETPLGYLVGGLDQVLEVLRDDGSRFSVKGTGERLRDTVGNIHLGFDADTPEYKREAPTINAALAAVTEQQAFADFRGATKAVLGQLLLGPVPKQIDLVGGLLEQVVAAAFPLWFGLPDNRFIAGGSQDWRNIDKRIPALPALPGDYWNTARYAFIPIPSKESERMAGIESRHLIAATEAWIASIGRSNLPGTITRQIAGNTKDYPRDEDVARVLTGTIMGAIATTLGNAARIIDTLAQTGELQRLAFDWRKLTSPDWQQAREIFGAECERLMQSRPVPELMWRTVQGGDQRLDGVLLKDGKKLILGTDSAAVAERDAGKPAYITFGMSHNTAPATPHGCPGRSMALGMILGWLAGLSDVTTIRWGGNRFVLELSRLG